MVKRLRITLGSPSLLHTGYHGALLSSPPRGVVYRVCSPLYCFNTYHDQPPSFSPAEHYSVSDHHYYIGRHSLIHSAHYPISNRDIPWVVDTDSILAYLLYGFSAYNTLLDSWIKLPSSRALILERAYRMLESYKSENCLALIFRTKAIMSFNERMCRKVLPKSLDDHISEIFEKAIVCYNAQAPRVRAGFVKKRSSKKTLSILFGARTFEDKGGDLVLKLYSDLLKKKNVNLIYIGPIPKAAKERYADTLSRITYRRSLDREEFHEELKRAHVFVMPTLFESPGNIFLEAMAFGVPVVTTAGPGMEGIEELVHDQRGGYLLRKRSLSSNITYRNFYDSVNRLIENSELRDRMSKYNLSLFDDGQFSLANRNKALLPYYKQALRNPRFFPSYKSQCHSRMIVPWPQQLILDEVTLLKKVKRFLIEQYSQVKMRIQPSTPDLTKTDSFYQHMDVSKQRASIIQE